MALSMLRFTKVNFIILKGEIPLLKNVPKFNESQRAWYPNSKHYNPLYRKQRREKSVTDTGMEGIPSMKEIKKMSKDELRKMQKKLGLQRVNPFDRDLTVKCTGGIITNYTPPEGDGKASLLSAKRAKDELLDVKKKSDSFMAIRKIKKFEDFDSKSFASFAQEIYTEAYSLLQDVKNNKKRILELVTETVYPDMTYGLKLKTLRWEFIESLEPPKVVLVRTHDVPPFGDFAQVTVRFHTKQKLAMYDRFGRLMFGSEVLSKNVLEYVVFEKHIMNLYGLWRIHGKIPLELEDNNFPIVTTLKKPTEELAEEDKQQTV